MDPVMILLRALRDYQETVQALQQRVVELEAKLSEQEAARGATASLH